MQCQTLNLYQSDPLCILTQFSLAVDMSGKDTWPTQKNKIWTAVHITAKKSTKTDLKVNFTNSNSIIGCTSLEWNEITTTSGTFISSFKIALKSTCIKQVPKIPLQVQIKQLFECLNVHCLYSQTKKVYLSTPNENWPLKIIVSQNFLKIYKSLKLLKRETFNEDKIKFKKMELVKENSILFVQNLKNLCQLWLTGSASTLWYNQLTQNLLG